ncbi:ParB/RepB/Spo0J family partition protein [Sphingosinicella humi]|nr:ParB/RepB/Spo0J family partition protein [Sphingosinicella humi]
MPSSRLYTACANCTPVSSESPISAPDIQRLRWRQASLGVSIIKLDRRFQPRDTLSENTVARYKAAMLRGDAFPPISVARIGRELFVVDGFHRLEAARAAGLETVEARVANMQEDTAVAVAIEANATHGLSLSRSDKRRCFALYVEAGRHLRLDGTVKSLRQIRRELANIAWPNTISRWLRDANIQPTIEDDGPVVSWVDNDITQGEGLDNERLSELQAFVDSADYLYQQLEDAESRLVAREWIKRLWSRVEAHDALEI